MKISFFKYQGTGNDFVMIDDRLAYFDLSDLDLVSRLCDRRFGIGADGLILIRKHPDFDFEMIYFNADGSQSMCGNGARCAVAFADYLEIISSKTNFLAIDGPHEAILQSGLVQLKMSDVSILEERGNDLFIHTGSPHHIRFVDKVTDYAVFERGKEVRYDQAYSPGGTNVNFVEKIGVNELFVRTYERGVEDETLSCGTGVTAAAIAFGRNHPQQNIKINTLGGELSVKFQSQLDGTFNDIWLTGPAEQVFEGKINI